MRARLVIAAVSCIAQVAIAQPQQQPAGKVDAKALMQSGLKLFEAKDYLGALAVFTDAYKRFPSAKILLNIGTTQALLERKADAANSYQRYLDSPDADPAKKPDVTAQIVELEKASGVLQLDITPDDAEVLLGDDWVPAKSVHTWRVVPGAYTVKVRKTGYQPGQKQDAIAAGAKAAVTIALAKLPEPEKQIIVVPRDDGLPVAPPEPRSRIGAIVFAHVSVLPRVGSAVFIGGTADVTEQLALDATLILGPGLVSSMMYTDGPPPSFGAYAGAKFAFLTGTVRPFAAAGLPIFFDDGARLFTRIAGGIEYTANRNLSFLLELGGEYGVNPRDDIRHFALVPSIGAAGRL